jgi:Cdc6-like AAA superfamily ATPase
MEEDYDGLISQHRPKTCDWFLDRPEFRQWISHEESSVTLKVLWVYGPPGFGKTILCARVIKHLKQNLESLMAFFFCASNNQIKQCPSSIIHLWVSQLVFQSRDTLAEATNVYQAMEKRTASQKE